MLISEANSPFCGFCRKIVKNWVFSSFSAIYRFNNYCSIFIDTILFVREINKKKNDGNQWLKFLKNENRNRRFRQLRSFGDGDAVLFITKKSIRCNELHWPRFITFVTFKTKQSQMNSERNFFIFVSTCRLDITNNNYYFDAQIFVAERSDWILIKWLSCFELISSSCFKCFNLFEILAHQYKFWFYYKTLRVIRFHCDNQSSLICRHEPSININATLHAVCGSWCMRRSRC